MTFGVTTEGFVLKRLADILSEATTKLQTIQDPETGEFLQPDFESADPAMQVVLIALESVSIAWLALQQAYNQFSPDNATGAALSSLVQLNGIARLAATSSTVGLNVTGTPTVTIPIGQTVSDVNSNNSWITDTPFTFDGGGAATTTATNILTGPLAATAALIDTIVTPVADWDTVTNPLAAVLGRNEETDTELRRRREISTLAPAAGPPEAVFANLRNVTGVTHVRVRINNTLAVDSDGIPAKNQATVVQGGDDDEIAAVIFQRSGAGVEFFGNTSRVVTDAQGESYTIKWTRPTLIPIIVQVDVTVIDATTFPTDGADQIKQAIVDYSISGASAFGITDGFNPDGFAPGEDIILSRLYTPVNSVNGHTVTLLEIGNPTLGISDITIAFDELGTFQISDITVNVT